MAVDPARFKLALSRFASGVTVVTANKADGSPVGVTVSAFSSLSLAPPLVLVCLDKATGALQAFRSAEIFGISILAAGQEAVSNGFAFPGPVPPFEAHKWHPGVSGVPLIDGALAHLECRLRDVLDGGDHLILTGEVEEAVSLSDGGPLLYFRGIYGGFEGGR